MQRCLSSSRSSVCSAPRVPSRRILSALLAVMLICSMTSSLVADAAGTNIYGINYGAERFVYVDIELLSIRSVDGASQTFVADFFLGEVYQDNTHNVTTAWDEEIDQTNQVFDHVALEFTNSASVTTQYEQIYASWEAPAVIRHFDNPTMIAGLPWIRVESRIQGTFKINLPLQNFPFDQQTIQLKLESSDHPIESCVFVVDTHSDMLALLKPLDEWTLDGQNKEVVTNYYHIFNETYSLAIFTIDLTRVPTYYMDKIVTGIVFLVIMSWFLFCLPMSDTNRQTCSATIFLAQVGYIFVITADTPKIPYTTKLGSFINLSLSEVFITYIYYCFDVAIDRLAAQAKEAALEQAKADLKSAQQKGEHNNGSPTSYEVRDFNVSTEVEEGAATTEDHPASGKKDLEEGNGASSTTKTKGKGDDDHDDLSSMSADDLEVEGWWNTWDSVKYKIDGVFLAILVIVFVVSAPILLKH